MGNSFYPRKYPLNQIIPQFRKFLWVRPTSVPYFKYLTAFRRGPTLKSQRQSVMSIDDSLMGVYNVKKVLDERKYYNVFIIAVLVVSQV